jgi:hypothetical protein
MEEKDYEPYGKEWHQEMRKFPKAQLIIMLGEAYKKAKPTLVEGTVAGGTDDHHGNDVDIAYYQCNVCGSVFSE